MLKPKMERWRTFDKGRWVCKLIKDLDLWVGKIGGTFTFYLNQVSKLMEE